jgi:hypothetical protein
MARHRWLALDRLQTPLVPVDHLTRSHHIRINTLAPQLNSGAALDRRADEQLIQTALDGRPLIQSQYRAPAPTQLRGTFSEPNRTA